MSVALLTVNGIEVIYNHVILVLKGVSLTVPEGKIVKSRVHLDLTSSDMAAEVVRLGALGALVLRDLSEMDATWTVMTDPEGNEFCVVSGRAHGT